MCGPAAKNNFAILDSRGPQLNEVAHNRTNLFVFYCCLLGPVMDATMNVSVVIPIVPVYFFQYTIGGQACGCTIQVGRSIGRIGKDCEIASTVQDLARKAGPVCRCSLSHSVVFFIGAGAVGSNSHLSIVWHNNFFL